MSLGAGLGRFHYVISPIRPTTPPAHPHPLGRVPDGWGWPRIWAVSLGAGLLIGVLESLHGYIGFSLADQQLGGFTMPTHPATLPAILARALPSWLWIGLVMPGAVWLARRIPLQPGIEPRQVLAHLAGALLFAALCVAGASTLRFSLFVQPVSDAAYSSVVLRYYAIYYNLFFCYYWTVVGVYSAVRYHREVRVREVEKRELEAVASRARLEALRRQIHPHFLFNLLNAISSHVLEGDPRRAVHAISDLSQLLRVSFSRQEAFVTLGEELEFLEMYLELHRLRLEGRLRFRRSVPPDLLDAAVPTFILQPLVENAVEHGVALRSDGGTISVEARLRGGTLELAVRNPMPSASARRRGSSGVGLAITRERVARGYPGEGTFEFAAEAGEAVARLGIPHRAMPGKEAEWATGSAR